MNNMNFFEMEQFAESYLRERQEASGLGHLWKEIWKGLHGLL